LKLGFDIPLECEKMGNDEQLKIPFETFHWGATGRLDAYRPPILK
jgi:hypothetical protein